MKTDKPEEGEQGAEANAYLQLEQLVTTLIRHVHRLLKGLEAVLELAEAEVGASDG